jgi:DNA processing protein
VPTPIALTRLDPRYPSRLVNLERAPPSISWLGGPLEAERTIAVLGSRHACSGALAFAAEVARALVGAGVVVVSGGAAGIDAAAHESALRAGGRTWAVAATSPEHCYPPAHAGLFDSIARGPGAMLWPFNASDRGAFLARNRVLVALADAVVVVQAGLRSGALHAASCARKVGKPLWVVPAAPWMSDFAGSLKLLDDGARVLASIDPLLRSVGLSPATDSKPGSPGSERLDEYHTISVSEYMVLQSISDVALHVDAIVARTNQSAQTVAAALLTLALENVVVEGPPGFFRRRHARNR